MSIDATTWAWRQKLSPTQKLILLSMADRAGEDHTCWPSNARLCLDTGLNRKTVYAVIAQLVGMGLIVRNKNDGVNNVYKLVGVVGREQLSPCRPPMPCPASSPRTGTSPESNTSPENGQQPVPKTDFDQSQNRDTNLKENLRQNQEEQEGASAPPAPVLVATLPLVGKVPQKTSPHGKPKTPLPAQQDKQQYGEFHNVLLSPTEHESLCAKYGPQATAEAIELLDLHLGAKAGKSPYKSHYLAMRKWVFDAVAEKKAKLAKQTNVSLSRPSNVQSFDQLLAEQAALDALSSQQRQENLGGYRHETPTL